ncbi:ntf2-related export protein 2, partial [Plakobranchus ocellatus]
RINLGTDWHLSDQVLSVHFIKGDLIERMDHQARVAQANTAAQEFSKLYYETFDKRRQAISKLYKDKASAVWNGNAVSGSEAILKFFDKLPASEHNVEGLDTQPIVTGSMDSENSNSIMVTVFGKVKFKDADTNAFTQTFVLSAADNKWKIISDTFRFVG